MGAERSAGLVLWLSLAASLGACHSSHDALPLDPTEPGAGGPVLARTPPMGFNTFNLFFCSVDEQLVRDLADSMVTSGMRDAGYRYVVIDDCWQAGRDSATGRLLADPQLFPNGMRALADYIHGRGLRFGLYTSAGRNSCQSRVGSYGHYDTDARTFADWGVDFVKADWCGAEGLDPREEFARFGAALRASGRPIIFSICEWGTTRPWDWAPSVGHIWRTSWDIHDRWDSMLHNADVTSRHAGVAGPGRWNDPDMLEVGNGGMTAEEYRAHFSLWAILAAPLIAGNDIRSMPDSIRDILTNREVVAVDQDSLGIQGGVVSEPQPGLQVWVRPLSDGSRAVALLNRTDSSAAITVDWATIDLPDRPATVRDLWAHADRGEFAGRYAATVPSHGVVMVRITGRPAR